MKARKLAFATALLGALAAALPSGASASVQYFAQQGCPVDYRAESISQFSREKRSEYEQALNNWEFDDVASNFRAEPPVNWKSAPGAGALSKLHQMKFLDRLYAISEDNRKIQAGDKNPPFTDSERATAVQHAVAIIADWARAALAGSVPKDEAWKQRVAGIRLPYLAFGVRRAACSGLLGEADAAAIKRILARHAAVLSEAPPKTTPENHKLSINIGAALLRHYFPKDPSMVKAAAKAEQRFLASAASGFDKVDGFWLEHSPRYQRLALDALRAWLEQVDPGSPQVQSVYAALLSTLGRLLMPDNTLVTFGDTSGEVIQDGTILGARNPGFYSAYSSGYGGFSDDDSWFGLTAQYHARQHKQSDELTFDLFESGRHVIQDTGFFGKDRTAVNLYQEHSRAHSTLTINGQSFNWKIHQRPYGSGLLAAGQGGGWYGWQATNPLLKAPTKLTKQQKRHSKGFVRKLKKKLAALAKKNVDHTRTYLYKPGEALIIADRARSQRAGFVPAVQRHFQFAPGIEASKVSEEQVSFEANPGIRGSAFTDASVPSTVQIVAGQDNPLQGYAYPLTGQVAARPAVIWTAPSTNALDSVTVLTYGGPPVAGISRVGEFTPGGIQVALEGPGGQILETISVARDGRNLSIGTG